MENMDLVYEFVDHMCKKYNIDQSHDLTHAKDCVGFAKLLLEPDASAQEQMIVLYAAALHDTVDKKYVPVKDGCAQVRIFLYGIGLSDEDASVIINIISTMSYSYLKQRRFEGKTYPNHGQWMNAYHIVRHADLLCSYRVERCFLYQKHITPSMSDEMCWEEVTKLFEKRMMRYVMDNWIFLPKAIMLVGELFKQAAHDLSRKKLKSSIHP